MKSRFYSSEVTAYDYLQARAPRWLWERVLEQAKTDIVSGPAMWEFRGMRDVEAIRRLRLEITMAAEEWVADDRTEPRSFIWVCEQLGLEPSAVRRAIAEQKLRKETPCSPSSSS